jgi:aldose 1-epimerase
LLLVFTAVLRADVAPADFGKTRDGSAVRLFTITNKSGSSARIMTYGATVISLKMPDRAGLLGDVVLGFDNIDGYLQRNNPYFGAIVGRYANRIRGATFSLDGAPYKITNNDRGNTLHGGRRGFDKVLWNPIMANDRSVEFAYLSKDGEEGFPGNLTVHVRYSLSDDNELTIDYSAATNKNTVVNLTNHSYFNLAGAGNGDVLNHELSIDADQYTPVDALSIPTGKLADVAGTPLDFRAAHKIADHIGDDDPQLHFANGYDHNYVLNKKDLLHPVATVYERTTGREMKITTTEPGLQFYTGNGLNGSITGKDGKKYEQHAAFCLETQHFPDSPNQPQFPGTELKAGETYISKSVYKFSTRPDAPVATSAAPAAAPSISLATGWSLLQEGQAQGTIEQDAKHPASSSPHLLRIAITKTAGPGEGRAGAVSGVHFAVEEGEWCDVNFSAATERGSIGLVFSLENSDGKVLARTTLPEIGRRGGRGRGRGAPVATATPAPAATVPTAWPNYLVGLHVRAADANAHVVITPIEPTNIWLDGLTLTPRQAAN